jgi:hypothetical protein
MSKKKSKQQQPGSDSEDDEDIATAQNVSPPSTSGDGSGLPKHLELQRTRMICGPEMNYHVRLRHLLPGSFLRLRASQFDISVSVTSHVHTWAAYE